MLDFVEYLSSLYAHISLKDFFDLIILWLVIYRIMVLTERSGVIKILLGLVLLAILHIASIQFQLITIQFILDNLFNNLFLILVVLFQNEIKKVLIEIGSPMFSKTISLEEENRIVDEVSAALRKLQKSNWGAIIIVEKDMDVDAFIEQGTLINSEVSANLIISLFEPKSPLHDGAILIREGRIVSVRNFLPLSKNSALDKNLGARHRAALGLSELVDARIFIVSEGRKNISFVNSGTLEVVKDISKLKLAMVEFLAREPK